MRESTTDRRGLWTALGLAAVVLAAAAWALVFAAKVTEPFVWPDELTYAKEASRIWELHRLLLPSEIGFNSWAQMQPLLMSPFWGTQSTQTAYHATHVLNALLLASTAIPAYLLARRLAVGRALALAAATLCVLTPWMTFAGVMMTEVAAFPVFAWALLALQAAVANPSRRNDLLAIVALGAAFISRSQLVALAPAFAVAIVVHEARFSRGSLKEAASRHVLLIAAAAVALVVLAVSGGISSQRLFGSYSGTSRSGLFPPGTIAQGLEALAYVAIAIAVVPLALSLAYALQNLVKPQDREQHAFALLSVTTGIFLTYLVGLFSAQFTQGVQDRYLFFLVVPMFVGAAAWLTLARPNWWALGAAALFAAAVAWRSDLLLRSPTLVSPSAAWHQVLFGRTAELNDRLGTHWLTTQRLIAAVTIAACAALVLARRLRPRWWPVVAVVPAVLALYCVAETQYTMNKIADFEQPRDSKSWSELDWIDDRLPDGASAPVVLSDMGSPPDAAAAWKHVRFWNREAGNAYWLDTKLNQPFAVFTEIDREKGSFPALDGERYVVTAVPDKRFHLQGAKSLGSATSVQLLELPGGAARFDWVLDAASDAGLLPVRRPATLRVFPPAAGDTQRVTIAMTTNFQTAGNYRYRIEGHGVDRRGLIKIGKSKTETFDVRVPPGGYADLRLSAAGRVHPDYPLGGLVITDLRTAPGG
ncbi:MAG TPA: glycosyltransferase family 39 protein [Burkholderiaceae bacterium]|nr:glycosyltransferase family 39 protein [Burkholderiaceae bacterium]